MSSSAPAEDYDEAKPPTSAERPDYVPYKTWPVNEEHPGYIRGPDAWFKDHKYWEGPHDARSEHGHGTPNADSRRNASFKGYTQLNLKIPIFNNTVEDWPQFLNKCNLYKAQMELNGQSQLAGMNVLSNLQGISWQLCDS